MKVHRIRKHTYTHNGDVTVWWDCEAGDWHQDAVEHGQKRISPRLARERFNTHLPKSQRAEATV